MTASTGRYVRRGAGLEAQLLHSISPEPNTGCWLWTGTTNKTGYGRLTHKRRTIAAHRAAYEVFCEPIPEGAHILHKCDVRCCVNPAHMMLGTNADNVRDKVAKGRQARGERMNRGRVTEELARSVREFSGSTRAAAAYFGISKSHVHAIRAGLNWKHIT